jgi:phosphoserine phosphatase RsbU/P
MADANRAAASSAASPASALQHLADAALPLVADAPVGFALLDTDLRFVLVNRRLAEIDALPLEDHGGRRLEEALPTISAEIGSLLRKVIATGEPVDDVEIAVDTSRSTGRPAVWRESYFPVHDPDGTVIGVGAVVVDVTEQHQNREELRRANALLRLAHQASASGAYQWRPQRGTVEWTPEYRALYGFEGTVEGSYDRWIEAVHPADRSWLDADTETALRTGDGWHNTFRILHPTRGVRWIESISRIERDPTGKPLVVTGLNIDVTDRRRAEDEVQRLWALERDIAHRLQEAMLPHRLPAVPGVHLAARHLAGTDDLRVGGDWYDAIGVAPGQVVLVIGDVVGHDIEAAIAMGQIRNAIAGLSFARSDPAEVLCHLDEFIAHQPGLRNTTLGYGRIEVSTGWLRYASAGHPPPLLVRSDGSAEYFEGGRSGPLGQATARCEDTVRLRPGDTLVLYTDGLVERRGVSIDDGLERLAAAGVAARAEHVDHLADHLLAELLIDAGQRDDIALLVVRLG